MSEDTIDQAQPAASSSDAAPPAAAPPAPEQPQTRSDSSPASKPSYAEDRKAREASILTALNEKFGGKTPAAAEPAPKPAAVTPSEPNPAPESKTPPNPKEGAPPPPQAIRQEALTIKDREGKDLTITLDQAKHALLRDGMDAETLDGLSKKRQLEFGSKRFLAQRDQDQFGSKAAEWRRVAEAKAAAATPATSSPPPATKADAAAPAPANHGQAANPASAPQSLAPPATPESQASPAWRSKLQGLRDVAGDDVATTFETILSDALQETLQSARSAHDQQMQAMQQQQQSVANMLVNDRFRAAFSQVEKDFPQIADPAIREEVRQYAHSIAGSGRFADPFSELDTIVREACYARLGQQQQENSARKLLNRQHVQKSGQVDAGEARKAAPSGALSAKELAMEAFGVFQKTGSHTEANQRIRDLTATRG
jgi:hypothetical protein